MYKELKVLKERDWSLNLEDVYFEEHPEEIVPESLQAIRKTAPGCYVNLVTPASYGDPQDGLIAQLESRLGEERIPYEEIRYIDQCGCGGYVTRVYR